MRILRPLATALLLSAPLSAQQTDTQLAARLERHFASLVPFGASGSVVVIRDSTVIYRGGFGMADVAARRPMGPAVGVDIASMTKQMTAVAIVRLAAQGALRLSDSLSRWIPGVPADKAGITINHLLLHQSGLPQFVVPGNDFVVVTRDSMLHAILSATLDFAPGTADQYSDAGYTLLAIILERVTGTSWERHLEQTFFGPLRLRNTSAYATTATRARRDLAHGYLGAEDHGSPGNYVNSANWWALKGAGGILSTADDIAAWELGLAGLLGPATMDTLLKLRIDDGGRGQTYYGGLDVMPSGHHAYVRTGAQDFGFAAGVLRYPDDGVIAVVVLNRQLEGMDISYPRDALLRDLDGFLFGTPPEPAPAARADLGGARGRAITGVYVFADSSTVTVEQVEGNLLLRPSGRLATDLVAFGSSSNPRQALGERALAATAAACTADTAAFRGYLANPRALARYGDYIRTNGCVDGRPVLRVLGTIPRWYAARDRDWLVTLVEGRGGDEPARFRFEWTPDGHIGALGGSGIELPAVRVARAADGSLVGFHLGIRNPIRLTVSPERGRISFGTGSGEIVEGRR